MSQNDLKSRAAEFNRAISELEAQKRDPQADVVTVETVNMSAAAPAVRAAPPGESH